MRIVGPPQMWRIILTSDFQPQCLHDLALRCGYRVGEICAELHCSTRYLHEVFTRDIGLPPKTWMRQERMEVARRLLENGEPPHAVAQRLGFTLAGNFRREWQRSRSSEWNTRESSIPGVP